GGQQRRRGLGRANRRASGLGQPGQLLADGLEHGGGVGPDGAQQRRGGAALLADERRQQVQSVNVGVAGGGRALHRLRQSLLALAGQLVGHSWFSFRSVGLGQGWRGSGPVAGGRGVADRGGAGLAGATGRADVADRHQGGAAAAPKQGSQPSG